MPQAEPVLDVIVLLVGFLCYCIGPPAQSESVQGHGKAWACISVLAQPYTPRSGAIVSTELFSGDRANLIGDPTAVRASRSSPGVTASQPDSAPVKPAGYPSMQLLSYAAWSQQKQVAVCSTVCLAACTAVWHERRCLSHYCCFCSTVSQVQRWHQAAQGAEGRLCAVLQLLC